MPTNAVPRLDVIALDCPDPRALAGFYARLLEWSVDEAASSDEWVSLRPPARDGGGHGVGISFQRSTAYRPPTWPDPTEQQMLHLDLRVDDDAMDDAHRRAVELGARHLDTQSTFRVFADPAGHPFCLCAC